ncbi:MAG: hypothetical protein ABSD57_06895 [Verrucomicrobiota bacterium]|jgi:hypothetical protein
MPFEIVANVCEDIAFAVKRFILGPYRVRRVQLYGVGIGKSGTHSIAKMFSHRVRVRHEPQAPQLIDKVIDWHNGRISEQEITGWLRQRDRELALEVDSSGINFQIIDLLLREFPNARFVLAIRDCYSWTNSRMNGDLNAPDSGPWNKWIKFVYGDGPFIHAPEEKVLKNGGLYTLDTYLSSWATRNSQVLAKVPPERLFVVRTDQIREKAFALADFAGLPRRVIRLHRTHEFRNPGKRPILREIDRDFLERKVEQHCRPLMTQFFPEIKSLDDAKL